MSMLLQVKNVRLAAIVRFVNQKTTRVTQEQML